MQKKQKLKWMGLCILGVGILWMPLISEANDLALILQTARKIAVSTEKISPIHFADNGNDFWGLIYISDIQNANSKESVNPYEVELNSEKYNCKSQAQWFYYDAQRWERLWPLDEDTKKQFGQTDLVFSGWLYTSCVKSEYEDKMKDCDNIPEESNIETCKKEVNETYWDNWGYYGQIQHTYSWKMYNFVAGVNYQTGGTNEWIKINDEANLSPTFMRYDNIIPLWLIYDSNGWVWFVWCKIEGWTDKTKQQTLNYIVNQTVGGNKISGLFKKNSDDTLVTTIVGAKMDCSNASATVPLIKLVIEWVVWMSKDTNSSVENNVWSGRTQLFATSSVNNATLINYTKQKAETLCRGKWVSNCNAKNCTDNVVCIDNTNIANPIEASNHKWKTLIVKWWDVKVSPLGPYSDDSKSDDSKYDIFIDGWNLIINESGSWNIIIQRNGFMTGANVDYYKESITSENLSTSPIIWVASVLRWNFIVNGHITGSRASLSNKYFVYGKLSSLDTYDELGKLFTWRCDSNFMWSDGYVCPPSVYQYAALSVIDQNYPSPLL